MVQNPKPAAELPSSLFQIKPGTQIIISPSGFDERIRTSFTGHEKGKFFLVKLPAMAANGLTGLYDFLYQGNKITVTYLHDGNIWGFNTTVQSYAVRPHPLLFLDFPANVENHRLRKENRIECLFPVQAELGQSNYRSVLMDISRSGCRLVLEGADAAADLNVGDKLSFKCSIFGENGDGNLSCQIRGLQRSGKKLTVGAAFTDLSAQVRDRIDDYVRTVSTLLDERDSQAS